MVSGLEPSAKNCLCLKWQCDSLTLANNLTTRAVAKAYACLVMRSLLQFAIFLVVVFFVVGEFLGGWYLGVPPQTPVFLYKKTTTATVTRRTLLSQELPFGVDGRLSRGTVTIEGIFERPESFQNPDQKASAPKVYFSESFGEGERIDVNEVLKRGPGVYRLRFTYDDASGTLRIDVPSNSDL